MSIDVGRACGDGDNSSSNGVTVGEKFNGANAAGTITTLGIQALAAINGLEFAVMTDNGSNSLTCQTGHHCSGANLSVGGGTCEEFYAGIDFTVFSVDADEYLFCYFIEGNMEAESLGADPAWWKSGDYISDNNTQTYSTGTRPLYMYAAGTEAGWTGKVLGINNPTKVLGVSDIAKVMGV